MSGGVTIFICGGRSRRRCGFCGRPAQYQCDSPIVRNGKKGTCDKHICHGCANRIAKDVDLCPPHFRVWEKNGKSFVL